MYKFCCGKLMQYSRDIVVEEEGRCEVYHCEVCHKEAKIKYGKHKQTGGARWSMN